MDKLKTGKNQDELEMDQLAHAELNRLQRQVIQKNDFMDKY